MNNNRQPFENAVKTMLDSSLEIYDDDTELSGDFYLVAAFQDKQLVANFYGVTDVFNRFFFIEVLLLEKEAFKALNPVGLHFAEGNIKDDLVHSLDDFIRKYQMETGKNLNRQKTDDGYLYWGRKQDLLKK